MRTGLLGRLEAPVAWLRAPEVLGTALAQRQRDAGVRRSAHGTLPALVYESLACGALPVAQLPARGGRGRPRPADVHHVRGAGRRHLRAAAPTPRAPRPGAAALREVVLGAHTWDHRAAQLDALVRERLVAEQAPPPAKALHYFPDYNRANPYQGMLFAGLDAVDAYPVAVTDVISHLENRAVSAVPGTLNIHWTTPILQYAAGPLPRRDRARPLQRRPAQVPRRRRPAGLDAAQRAAARGQARVGGDAAGPAARRPRRHHPRARRDHRPAGLRGAAPRPPQGRRHRALQLSRPLPAVDQPRGRPRPARLRPRRQGAGRARRHPPLQGAGPAARRLPRARRRGPQRSSCSSPASRRRRRRRPGSSGAASSPRG